MQKDVNIETHLVPEIQEIIKHIITAIRSVRLYPSNNPIYFNSVKRSFELLNNYLQRNPYYQIGVQKNYLSVENIPFAKESDINKPIANDLYSKEIRKVLFSAGLGEAELLDFYQLLALSAEEIKGKGGISFILWEKNFAHIKITEAKLDEVITAPIAGILEKKDPDEKDELIMPRETIGFPGRTLVLTDLNSDPSGFGANMVELAKQTKTEEESVEDKLFALYKEAGKNIDEGDPSQRETLYQGLAKSVLSLDSRYRDGFIAGKLFGEYDAEIFDEEERQGNQYLPSMTHEVITGRFSNHWTLQQITILLKKTAAKQTDTTSSYNGTGEFHAEPIDPDIVKEVTEINAYSSQYLEDIQAIADRGDEADIMECTTWTLISLIPFLNDQQQEQNKDNVTQVSAGVMKQLEKSLEYFLRQNNYEIVLQIVQALQIPMDDPLKKMVSEVINKALPKSSIVKAIEELHKAAEGSAQYHSVYSYLIAFEQEATQVLLELLAEEKDRNIRFFYLDLVKDIGKNQIALLGKHLSDVRWYFVRNIVIILGESKADQALTFLKKVAGHKDTRIRHEVIQGLIAIGGKKVVPIVASFFTDKDDEIRKESIRALSSVPDIGPLGARPLISFLEQQPLKKKEQEFTLEAIESLGRIGDNSVIAFLSKYERIRWWKSRKLQKELRNAARKAREEITRRHG
jgi:HEAT repeat protein